MSADTVIHVDTDLDRPPVVSATPGRVTLTWWAFAIAVAAAGAIGVLVPSVLTRSGPGQDPSTPTVIVAAAGNSPTITVWYADGSQGEGSVALTQPWTPPKPIRMITVAAEKSCSITVNERLATIEAAPVNRLAVCVWVAP